MHTEAEKAYMAGFLDGEGHVGITLLASESGRGRHTLVITITNRHIQTLRDLATLWNGSVVGVRQRNQAWSTVADLRWNTDSAVQLLQEIQPYLSVKKEQAQIGLAFAKTIRPRTHRTVPLSAEEWEYRETLRYQIQLLNSRKPEPPRKLPLLPTLTCQYCGKTFSTYQKRRKYCGQECSMAAGRDAYLDRHSVQKVCPTCGKTFDAYREQRYCSISCGLRSHPGQRAKPAKDSA